MGRLNERKDVIRWVSEGSSIGMYKIGILGLRVWGIGRI